MCYDLIKWFPTGIKPAQSNGHYTSEPLGEVRFYFILYFYISNMFTFIDFQHVKHYETALLMHWISLEKII